MLCKGEKNSVNVDTTNTVTHVCNCEYFNYVDILALQKYVKVFYDLIYIGVLPAVVLVTEYGH